ncbi:MAG: thioredoxin domain-containing protein [Bdellovibrionales bacterium]
MIKKMTLCLILPMILQAKPELRSQKALKLEKTDTLIKAELAAGHHFNEKAPNGLQSGSQFIGPSLFEKQKIEIPIKEKTLKQGTAHFYVCDDEVTYCEVHSVDIGSEKSKAHKGKQGSVLKMKHGFMLNAFNEAALKAKKENKLMLVDFSARWCPACLRLEAEIFSQKKFSTMAKDLIKVKLDGDLFSNAPLMEKYKVKGYPTVLFLTSDGEEIIRFMDYQSMDTVESFVKHAQQYPVSISELEKKSSDDSIQEGLWKRHYFSGDFEKALKVMESMKDKPKEYLSAQVELAISKENSEKKESINESIKALKTTLQMEGDTTRSLYWRSELISKIKDDKVATEILAKEAETLAGNLLSDSAQLTNALATDSIGEFAGFEKFYVALMYADVAEQANWKKEEAWKLAVKVGQESKISVNHPGASLRLFNAMMKAKEYSPALEVVNGLLKKNPKSGDLQRRKMRVLMELNRHAEAVKIGEEALKNSYGRNEFDVALPLAKSYLALNNKKRAQTLADLYLSKNEVNYPRLAQMKKDLEEIKVKALAQSEGPTETHPNKK